MSRRHARVFFSQGEVLIETVSKIKNVRINGIIVNHIEVEGQGRGGEESFGVAEGTWQAWGRYQ